MIIICVLSFCLPKAYSQILHPVKWSYGAKRLNKDEAVIFLKADIEDGWHIYSVNQKEGGPVKTSFKFEASLIGTVSEPRPITEHEAAFNMDVSYFEHEVIFQQKISLRQAQADIKGSVNFMTCNNQKCLPPETIEFTIPVK